MSIPKIPFFTSEVQDAFWQNNASILYVGMPLFLISMALLFSGHFIEAIRKGFERINDNDPDDEDYGEREYDRK